MDRSLNLALLTAEGEWGVELHLILRSERSERLEGWVSGKVRVPTLRDAALQAALRVRRFVCF
jgi:hypothetical protein